MKKKRDQSGVRDTLVHAGEEHKVLRTLHNEQGKVMHSWFSHFSLEFGLKDVVQIVVGSSLLAIPVGFTEETWKLGGELPLLNVVILMLFSMTFIAIFVYYNSYTIHLKQHMEHYLQRVMTTYFLSFIIVGLILTLIEVAPWTSDFLLAFKRVAIVTFPASLSAAVADMIK